MMKKFLCLLLASLLMLSLTACKPALNKNVWAMQIEVDHHAATQMLKDMSLYPEELSLVTEPLFTTILLRFDQDGTFTFYKDPATEKQCVKDFLFNVFDSLYESREYLSDTYQIDFSTSSKNDFIRFYTDMYSAPDYEAMVEKLADKAYDYTAFGELARGTYTKKGNTLTMDAEDNNYDDTVTFSIEDDQLTLVYVDHTDIYFRVK